MHRIIYLIAAAITLGACSHKAADSKSDALPGLDSLPAPVRMLITSVADSDSASFSRLVSYPLERPYPLHAIVSAKEMERYYATLMDDSLRREITSLPLSRWQQYGWRGWSTEGSYCIWLDDSIYSIPYTSEAEVAMRRELVNREMASLSPSMRAGWAPVGCYREADGKRIFRIDKCLASGVAATFRLAVYSSPESMRSAPEAVFTGSQQIDGTIMGVTYKFEGEDSTKAELIPEPLDDTLPEIEFISSDGKQMQIKLIPAYWLDILPQKQLPAHSTAPHR